MAGTDYIRLHPLLRCPAEHQRHNHGQPAQTKLLDGLLENADEAADDPWNLDLADDVLAANASSVATDNFLDRHNHVREAGPCSFFNDIQKTLLKEDCSLTDGGSTCVKNYIEYAGTDTHPKWHVRARIDASAHPCTHE